MSDLNEQQRKLVVWGTSCFGADHMADTKVRALRLLEEAIELAQAVDVAPEKCTELVAYVYSRAKGNPSQELGGIGVTWLVAAAALGWYASDALAAEVERISQKPPSHFAQRNQQKVEAGFR
jgi:NTP pyrophosphatase (non-canonical NTP hydrolase)